jgi:two-component system cell cycle sensor histidine kinase/response regulator CckA
MPDTIMLVDDDNIIRKLVSSALQRAGINVLEASSGYAALEIAISHEGDIHALLTDVVMPGMSGPQLAVMLKRARPNLKIILMSGHTAEISVNGYGWKLIQKPFRIHHMIGRIQELLNDGAQ